MSDGETPPLFCGVTVRVDAHALVAKMPQAQIVELEGQAHGALMMAPQLFVDKVTAFL